MPGPARPERRLSDPRLAWIAAAGAVLDARLQRDVGHPLAVALSGGGDSMALLRLAADWSARRGRRLLALTVDHGLNPDSPRWNAVAERAARAVGADWRLLRWIGPKPAAGLPAAARRARQARLADAARAAGARVILLAHTADDVAEADLMRAEGSSLGRLRDWAPSPAWPAGRGLMLLRPLLAARRAELRAWLAEAGAGWIDDPANDDPRFARARARRALAGAALQPMTSEGEGGSTAGVLAVEDDLIRLARHASPRALAAALVCAGGGDRPPRGDRLAALLSRLRTDDAFVAVLAGARISAHGDEAVVSRESGELRRRAAVPLALAPGRETVWDGRWALTAPGPGWAVVPAAGLGARLSDADRARLRPLPPAVRAARPVLIRNDPPAAVLAGTAVRAHALVEERLALALDRMTHESDLAAVPHGAAPRKHLFSRVTIMNDEAPPRPRNRDENEPA